MTALDHIRRRIEESEVIAYPFPHLLISEFFPDDLYRQMLAEIPMFDGNSGTNHAKFASDIWLKVRDEIYPEVLLLLEKTLFSLIDERIGELAEYGFFPDALDMNKSSSEFQLLQREDNFQIPPHIHAPSEYLSVLHYLPEHDDEAVYGTQIYPVAKPYEMNVPWNAYPHVPIASLGMPVTIPYAHNTAVIWVSTFKAIHGRTVTGVKRRYIYAYRLFANECVDFSTIDPARNGPMKIKVIP